MIVYRTKSDLQQHLEAIRIAQKSIGLVPTMGALHEGHTSLVRASKSDQEITIVTIFVNPSQFNDPKDLESYPRMLEKDLELLQSLQVDLVFVPSDKEMYPTPELKTFNLHPLDEVMEGKYRPNHFNGVAHIVNLFLEMIQPDAAYFGQKDFQQLVLIRRLAAITGSKTEIIACPIVREKDGLAMSSRNKLLTREERKIAPFIYETLVEALKMKDSNSPDEIKSWVIDQFSAREEFQLDYFEIVEDKELRPVDNWEEQVNKVGCIAVHLGRVRLIDNVIFN